MIQKRTHTGLNARDPVTRVLLPNARSFESTGTREETSSYSKDGQQINHSLSTAIVDADGKLITLMPGNAWPPVDPAVIVIRAALLP